VALRKSELLADLSEATWDAANFYSDVFCMELAAWEITTGLASEIPIRVRAGRSVGLWYQVSLARTSTRRASSRGRNRGRKEQEMSIFSTRILLATDGSEEAELALKTAVDLADCTNSELHVVTVGREYHPAHFEVPETGRLLDEARRVMEREAREVLDGQVKKIEEAGGTVAQVHLRTGGHRDREIVRVGEEIGAGLIVMGSRGLGGLRRALMGSVSDSVVRHAHCPVLVVRPPDKGDDGHGHSLRKVFTARSIGSG
jgi:nucleotide-binding universal stress UspA family protein